jgi:hypothetical protein
MLLFAVLVIARPVAATAQVGGGGFGGLGGGFGFGGGGNNANNGGGGQNSSGIKIDAQGVLSLVVANDGAGLLDKKRRESIAKKHLSQDINQRSKVRLISLVELEKQIDRLLTTGQAISDEMFYLAGLQRIDYVFVLPDEHDLLIGGPAEGFTPDSVGRMVGVETNRPTLRLDDLFVAMRTVTKANQVGCSIDPVPQRLADLQQFVKQGGPATADEVEARFNQMDDILGLQNVRIDGVPADSHFATMFVEADYRMKRIAVGLENPAVKGLKSHLATMGSSGNTIQRWWFVPYYDSIARSQDGLSFQFIGQRAQLLTDEEVADANGNRFSAGTAKKSVQVFAKQFTEKFPQLADKSPVFGELQNLIDWTMFAALLAKEQIPERIGWKRELMLDDKRLTYPVFDTPKKVPSSVSYKRAGNMVVGLVCGGVVLSPQRNYDAVAMPAKDSAVLNTIRTNAAESPRPEARRWWWDAAH